jgi:hypothetical protein
MKPRPRFGHKPRNKILERRNTLETDARYTLPNTMAVLAPPEIAPDSRPGEPRFPERGFRFFGQTKGPNLMQRYIDMGQEPPPPEQQTPEAFAAYQKAES